METIQQTRNKFTGSISFKLGVITILALLLLIPTGLIRSLINEREYRRDEVAREIAQGWGNEQEITGPILTIPYITRTESSGFEYNYLHILPDELNINGELFPVVKYRGIFEIILYTSDLNLTGSFNNPGKYFEDNHAEKILWEDAFLSVGISDLKGIRSIDTILLNNESLVVDQGNNENSPVYTGICTAEGIHESDKLEYNISLTVNGYKTFSCVPLGNNTNVDLKGKWNCASTSGMFVSDEFIKTDTSFSAKWKIPQAKHNMSQAWTGDKYMFNELSLGVSLIQPVDNYQKTTRSNKYAILFVGLTFLVFLFAEIVNKIKVHPIQYLLVGLGLVLFYSILLAFSEHLRFEISYLIASIAIVGLTSSFTYLLFKRLSVMLSTFTMLSALYLFLYILLQLEDYSLLAGNIGLFIILAIVMYFSLKIDWYNNKTELKKEE